MTDTDSTPTPDVYAQQHSDRLLSRIQQEIDAAGGHIPFEHYMQLCLYTPELGYYSSTKDKIGQQGDFTTAPEISPLFSRAFSRHLKDALTQLSQPTILEFGAGNGSMAAEILRQLDKDDCLPQHYYIIEASAYLQQKQRDTLEKSIPEWLDRISWLDSLPAHYEGVIIANEVCDAMPVSRLHYHQQHWSSRSVSYDENGLTWCDTPITDPPLLNRTEKISALLPEDTDYFTEVNLHAEAWLASLADMLTAGAIFIVDYGYVQTEYYHPERQTGTLMCYYQHQGHDDPFVLPGLQDITSHVDFTALAETAHQNGLDVAGFHSQADFLIAGDITDFLAEETQAVDTFSSMQYTAAVKQLILPTAMGENFKILSLSKALPNVLPRLQRADRRYQL